MILRLPVPLSPNRWPKHPMSYHREMNDYRKRAWIKAIQQVRPQHDPPLMVRVTVRFLLEKLRDDDNLSEKWVLDTLKQRQQGSVSWRLGICDRLGYFVDDSPQFLSLGQTVQEKVGRSTQAVLVEIVPLV